MLQVWGEQVRQKMVLGSGKKLAVSPVLYQWQTTMPFSSPDTTRFLSTGDQCTAVTEVCSRVWGNKNQLLVTSWWCWVSQILLVRLEWKVLVSYDSQKSSFQGFFFLYRRQVSLIHGQIFGAWICAQRSMFYGFYFFKSNHWKCAAIIWSK